MNIYKIEGNYSKRSFLVIAETSSKAVNVVYHYLENEGYTQTEINEMEFQPLIDFEIPTTERSIYEL